MIVSIRTLDFRPGAKTAFHTYGWGGEAARPTLDQRHCGMYQLVTLASLLSIACRRLLELLHAGVAAPHRGGTWRVRRMEPSGGGPIHLMRLEGLGASRAVATC